MDKLIDTPITFISYPPGACGTFLAALVHYFFFPQTGIKFDSIGSGHANKHIHHINDLYLNSLYDDFGKAIIENTKYDEWSRDDRIGYLRQNGYHPGMYNHIIISLHCADLNLFYEAFPHAKIIKIDIDNDDYEICIFNMTYKRLLGDPNCPFIPSLLKLSKNFEKNPEEEKQNFLNLNIKKLRWLDSELLKWSNNHFNIVNERILRTSFKEIISLDEEEFLDKILEFYDMYLEKEIYNNAIDALVHYRLIQPRLPE